MLGTPPTTVEQCWYPFRPYKLSWHAKAIRSGEAGEALASPVF